MSEPITDKDRTVSHLSPIWASRQESEDSLAILDTPACWCETVPNLEDEMNENQPQDLRMVLVAVMVVAILAVAGVATEVQLLFVAVLLAPYLKHDL